MRSTWVERNELERLRAVFQPLGTVVAEVDTQLRYVWIDNPHPDFDPKAVAGKRDDELLPASEALAIMDFKRTVIETRESRHATLAFNRSDGTRHYSLTGFPLLDQAGRLEGIVTVSFETAAPG